MPQDVDVQLKVWKDLAISKQILMDAATDALGLGSECSSAELKAALEKAIERANNADVNIDKARHEADIQITEYRSKMEIAETARAEAENKADAAEKAQAQAEHQLVVGKADNTEALKKARAEVTDKQNRLKAISKALADSPENVVRKLKTLKKQKMDESKARSRVESNLQSTRKKVSKLEADLEQQKALLEQAIKLAEQAKELHQLCQQADATIQKLSDAADNQIDIPELDQTAVEAIEQFQSEKKQ